uniref:Ubiquitin-like domain-containing protein n=1 Tax=Alexandrium monilatum TaxID=311494 RepID=A0A7S4QBY6_9DINO|mmetsp:Transcript_73268/g.218635  ORF Transcript_73268/g.218635 Transcript_73268/m.218635 type:complete len:223 (+) Transcript_73268:68-736(+)
MAAPPSISADSPADREPVAQSKKPARDVPADSLWVVVRSGLGGTIIVEVALPGTATVADLRQRVALAKPDFGGDVVLLLGDREVQDAETLGNLASAVGAARAAGPERSLLELSALQDAGSRIRAKLKEGVRSFGAWELDRLGREGDPESLEEHWGGDLEALYCHNDAVIDRLGMQELRDLDGLTRLISSHNLRHLCLSCCSSLGAGNVIWDLQGRLYTIGHY